MKKLLLTSVFALSLSACSTTGGLNPLPVEIQTLATQTQAIAQVICAFEPTAATIGAVAASLFPGGGAIDTVANGVAKAICSAVAGTPVPATPVPVTISASGRKGAGYRSVYVNGVAGYKSVYVNGISIEGQFMHKAHKLHKAKYINGVVINGSFVK